MKFQVGQLVKATCDMTSRPQNHLVQGFVSQGDTGIITEIHETVPIDFTEYCISWLTTDAFGKWWVKYDVFTPIEEFKHEQY